jgi:hypothetical protein
MVTGQLNADESMKYKQQQEILSDPSSGSSNPYEDTYMSWCKLTSKDQLR